MKPLHPLDLYVKILFIHRQRDGLHHPAVGYVGALIVAVWVTFKKGDYGGYRGPKKSSLNVPPYNNEMCDKLTCFFPRLGFKMDLSGQQSLPFGQPHAQPGGTVQQQQSYEEWMQSFAVTQQPMGMVDEQRVRQHQLWMHAQYGVPLPTTEGRSSPATAVAGAMEDLAVGTAKGNKKFGPPPPSAGEPH